MSQTRALQLIDDLLTPGPPITPAIRTKTCRGCQETLPLSAFRKARGTQDGYAGWCRACQKGGKGVYRSSPVLYTHKGKTGTLRQLAGMFGLSYTTVWRRVNVSNYSVAEALDRPVRRRSS